MTNNEYQRGYKAGRKKVAADTSADTRRLQSELRKLTDERQERVYLACLEMVMKHCGGGNWTIGDKKVNNAETYSILAKSFADNSIRILND